MKSKSKESKSKEGNSVSRRELFLKAAQGILAIGALNLTGLAHAQGQPVPGIDLRRRKNRDLLHRALTDLNFRKQLEINPAVALGKPPSKITDKHRGEIKRVLDTVKQVEDLINRLADELLCANGGPCGIAAPAAPAQKLRK
jgi:hypothetical protein